MQFKISVLCKHAKNGRRCCQLRKIWRQAFPNKAERLTGAVMCLNVPGNGGMNIENDVNVITKMADRFPLFVGGANHRVSAAAQRSQTGEIISQPFVAAQRIPKRTTQKLPPVCAWDR